jgi:hypothetical protein
MLATVSALAEPAVEQEGPLSPCTGAPDPAEDTLPKASNQWVVEIATAFSKQQALDAFNRVKQEHADILGDYTPIVVEQCDLSMGNKPQYSARIVRDSQDEAASLCNKLQQSGGSCLVQKD